MTEHICVKCEQYIDDDWNAAVKMTEHIEQEHNLTEMALISAVMASLQLKV